MFFVNTGRLVLGVTARRVFEGFAEKAQENHNLICQLNKLSFNPFERLISLILEPQYHRKSSKLHPCSPVSVQSLKQLFTQP